MFPLAVMWLADPVKDKLPLSLIFPLTFIPPLIFFKLELFFNNGMISVGIPWPRFTISPSFSSLIARFAIICLYEVLWSFTVLNAEITAQMVLDGTTPDIDRLAVDYPDPDRPWNLIFATKIWLVGFIISAHAFYLSKKPRKTLEDLEP